MAYKAPTPSKVVKKILELSETTDKTLAQIRRETGVSLYVVCQTIKAGWPLYYKRRKQEMIENDATWLKNLRLKRVKKHYCPDCGKPITLTPCLSCAIRNRRKKVDSYDFTGESITFSTVDENDFTGDTLQIKVDDEFLDKCKNLESEDDMAIYISAAMLADNYRELYQDDPVVAASELRDAMRHYLQNEPDPADFAALVQLSDRINRDAIALSSCAKRLRKLKKDLSGRIEQCRQIAVQEDNS